jgi:hypothetical protein
VSDAQRAAQAAQGQPGASVAELVKRFLEIAVGDLRRANLADGGTRPELPAEVARHLGVPHQQISQAVSGSRPVRLGTVIEWVSSWSSGEADYDRTQMWVATSPAGISAIVVLECPVCHRPTVECDHFQRDED